MFATYQRLGLSVWASDRQVIRKARTMLDKGVLRDPHHRAARHDFYRKMLRHHKEARSLCIQFGL